ncbi:MAG: TonB-dependent receptor, partial [Gammaproteobacteria bacterium]|nr:TonB-dependent receptor [Gammaproteobacteria bacterium]
MLRVLPLAGAAMGVLLFASVPARDAVAAERDESGMIEEIVVTSRRREESVQDVPLSVTVFGEEQIDRLKPTTMRDFEGLVPNMYMTNSAAGPNVAGIFIRGIGATTLEKTEAPQVGMIVDGLQFGSTTGALIDAFDMESVEMNRGPQGVLFGRNTLAGNVVVNRVKPQFNELGFKVETDVGNYDSFGIKGRVNVPLVDDMLALKIGVVERERDGYYDNENIGGTAADIDYSHQVVSLRFAPNDSVDAILTYDRIRDDSDTNAQDPRFDGDDPHETQADKQQPTTYDVDQLGLRVDWDLNDRWTLHSVTGWHDGADKVNQDFDAGGIAGGASPFAQLHTLRDQEFEVFTQELRITGDLNENFSVLGGIYYFDSELKFTQNTNNVIQVPLPFLAGAPCVLASGAVGATLRDNPNPAIGSALCQFPNARSIQRASEDVESWAFFGAVTWRPTAELEFTLGARYIDDEKDGSNAYFDFSDDTFDDRTIPNYDEFNFAGRTQNTGTNYTISDSWDDTIITASANWAFADNHRAYANYSEGFRSGGFSIRSARDASEAPYQPEDGWQFEAGIKNDFLDGRLRANLAYFYTERNGAQFGSVISLPPGSIPGTTTIVNNAKQSVIQGVDAEFQWLINDEFTLAVNGGFIDV